MKLILFGWLLKGRCDVSALDSITGAAEVIVLVFVGFIVYSLVSGRD